MLKPRVKFLNYVHQPIYFHPCQWCITDECARLFFKANSKEGKLLDNASSIWGWKEHARSMDLLYGQIFLNDYNFVQLEKIFSEGEKLVCMHFDRTVKTKIPVMPLFNPDSEDFEEADTPF